MTLEEAAKTVTLASELVERATHAAWEENRRLVMEAGMDMPSWHHVELDTRQRWRAVITAALIEAGKS